MAPDDESDDKTRIARVAPPPPKIPSAPPKATPPAGEREPTQLGSVPPPAAPAQPAATPPVPTAVPPAAVPAADVDAEEETVIIARPQRTAGGRLQRLQPPGRSELIALDRSSYTLGRIHTADIELFSATASRQHAQLTQRDGKWYIAPAENRVVRVNGADVRGEVGLTHKTRLQLGDDELLFLDETAPAEAPVAAASGSNRRLWIMLLPIAAAIAAAIWWFLNR